jgi:hypothetical protein
MRRRSAARRVGLAAARDLFPVGVEADDVRVVRGGHLPEQPRLRQEHRGVRVFEHEAQPLARVRRV